MTACFPPLIKPDRRFSRIRLSEFHFSDCSSSSLFGLYGMESILLEELAIRPAFIPAQGIAVFAP
jgi:hypothetical protein